MFGCSVFSLLRSPLCRRFPHGDLSHFDNMVPKFQTCFPGTSLPHTHKKCGTNVSQSVDHIFHVSITYSTIFNNPLANPHRNGHVSLFGRFCITNQHETPLWQRCSVLPCTSRLDLTNIDGTGVPQTRRVYPRLDLTNIDDFLLNID